MTKPLILIVGAGPTGLFFAYQMLKKGHPVRLIDRKEHLSQETKALGIHARTLEILDQTGLAEPFLAAGVKGEGVAFYGKNLKTLLDFKHLPSPYPYILFLPQPVSEQILYDHLKTLGAEVEWKTELTKLENGICYLRKPDGSEEILQPDWIIGADGGRSRVREGMGVKFLGQGFANTFVLLDIQGDIHFSPHQIHVFLGHKDPITIFPFPPNMYRLAFAANASEQCDKSSYSLEFIEQLFYERARLKLGSLQKLTWTSMFWIRTCHAEHFHKNNCFLMGDAAHVHSPIGGQGMNMSLQDAYNLSWKLDLVIKQASNKQILNTYEKERMYAICKILRTTEKITGLAFIASSWVRHLLSHLLYCFNLIPMFSKKISYKVSQLALNYCKCYAQSDNLFWSAPRTGARAPYARLEDGRSLFDLFRSQKHQILIFEQNADISHLIKRFSPWIDLHLIGGKDVFKAYKNGPKSVFVIRPDGYIGYRSKVFSLEALEHYLLSVLNSSAM